MMTCPAELPARPHAGDSAYYKSTAISAQF